eukprot:252456_1
MWCLLHRVLRGEGTRGLDGILLVGLPVLRDVVGERVVGVGRRHEDLDAEEHLANLERGGPLVLDDIEADAAELVDVGVVDAGEEAHLGRDHGVLLGEEELEVEDAALVGGLRGTGDDDVEVAGVLLGRGGADAGRGLLLELLGLLDDTCGECHSTIRLRVKKKK